MSPAFGIRHRSPFLAMSGAILILLALEFIVATQPSAWAGFRDFQPEGNWLEARLAEDIDERQALREVPPERRIVVIGTSQAAGLSPKALTLVADGIVVAAYTYPGATTFEMRALADRIASDGAAVVIWVSSVLDTHRTDVGAVAPYVASPGALMELADAIGLPAVIRQRDWFLRAGATALSPIFRNRHLFSVGGLRRLRSFPTQVPADSRAPFGAIRLNDEVGTVAYEQMQQLRSAFQRGRSALDRRMDRILRSQANLLAGVMQGPHVVIHDALRRSALETLAAAGTTTIVVEAPIHPAGSALIDAEAVAEFRRSTTSMTAATGAVFLRAKDADYDSVTDFRDLTHLNTIGSAKLTVRAGLVARELLSTRR